MQTHEDLSAPARPRTPTDARRGPGRLLRILISLAGIAITVTGGMGLLALAGRAVAEPVSESAEDLIRVDLELPVAVSLPQLDQPSIISASDGTLLSVLDREVTRKTLPLERIPRRVQRAVIAAEDRRFFDHPGYDIEGIGRAVVANIQAGDITEGGSTITQQLAKSQVGSERTLQRKTAELRYAIALEKQFTKRELLEHYLNYVYFGSRAYGIAAATQEFFHTTPQRLRVEQGALLAALIRAPNSTDPRTHPRLALRRRNSVLEGMAEEGYIRRQKLPRLLERPLGVRPAPPQDKRRARRVIDAVEREFLQTKALAATRQERERLLYFGGLRITATVDPQLQRSAIKTIRRYLPYGTPTAAIATVDPATGAIKAMASGLPYQDLKYDLATQGRRQPGSAFKPFVYAAALADGFPPDLALTGSSPAYFEGVPGWERDCNSYDKEVCGVSNYGGASYGTLDMADALKKSVNSAAAQLTLAVGPDRLANFAERMNIDMDAATNGQVTASIGLGGLDQGVTPLEMAAAYAVFANEGQGTQPHVIDNVKDASGQVIYEANADMTEIIDPVVNAAVVDMMRGVVTGGTGTAAAVPYWEVAGKTGTTTDNVDAWFAGYTPVLSTAVWVGHAEGQVPMPGMTGGSVPATIWRDYMTDALNGYLVTDFPEPDYAALDARIGDLEVVVPNVIGMDEAEALIALGKEKLVGDAHSVPSSSPAGTVVSVSPATGEQVHPGEPIKIGVSDGTTSPDLDFPEYVPPPLSSG